MPGAGLNIPLSEGPKCGAGAKAFKVARLGTTRA